MKKILVLIVITVAKLTLAQTPVLHNVLLTWDAQGANIVFHVYKAPSVCPAAGTKPSAAPFPFSALALATTNSYLDVGAISVGQSWCYYVTADLVGGGAETGPSNYAQASIALPTPIPVTPGNAKATVQ